MNDQAPFGSTYWVKTDSFLAGCYPLLEGTEDGRQLRALLKAGINEFIDLTRPGELPGYETYLQELANQMGTRAGYQRFAVMDFGVPNPDAMRKILDAIDLRLDQGKKVYLHCWAGIGRTGTVVGCWLVRKGWTGTNALEEIKRLRANLPDWYRTSPETPEQREMVRAWREP